MATLALPGSVSSWFVGRRGASAWNLQIFTPSAPRPCSPCSSCCFSLWRTRGHRRGRIPAAGAAPLRIIQINSLVTRHCRCSKLLRLPLVLKHRFPAWAVAPGNAPPPSPFSAPWRSFPPAPQPRWAPRPPQGEGWGRVLRGHWLAGEAPGPSGHWVLLVPETWAGGWGAGRCQAEAA